MVGNRVESLEPIERVHWITFFGCVHQILFLYTTEQYTLYRYKNNKEKPVLSLLSLKSPFGELVTSADKPNVGFDIKLCYFYLGH